MTNLTLGTTSSAVAQPEPPDAAVVTVSKRVIVKQQREQTLLALAQHILAQEGFAGLTMDRLTSLSTVSKGTIYNHFCSKEDLLTALSVASLQRQIALLSQALQFQGNSREQAMALHYAYSLFAASEPTLFLCLISASTPGVVEKSSSERLAQRQHLEMQLVALCQQVMEHALNSSQLKLRPGLSLDGLAFINWAMSFGQNALFGPTQQLGLFSGLDQQQVILSGINLLFDGLGWQPLSSVFDYQHSWQRIGLELFQQ